MAREELSMNRMDADGDVKKYDLSWQPLFILVDNMSNVPAYLFDQVRINPIGNAQPIEKIPARSFKLIVVPEGMRKFTLAWAGDATAADDWVRIVVTDRAEYARHFHQSTLPAVRIEGNIDAQVTNLATLETATAGIGNNTDQIEALLSDLKTLLTATNSKLDSVVSATDQVEANQSTMITHLAAIETNTATP